MKKISKITPIYKTYSDKDGSGKYLSKIYIYDEFGMTFIPTKDEEYIFPDGHIDKFDIKLYEI